MSACGRLRLYEMIPESGYTRCVRRLVLDFYSFGNFQRIIRLNTEVSGRYHLQLTRHELRLDFGSRRSRRNRWDVIRENRRFFRPSV